MLPPHNHLIEPARRPAHLPDAAHGHGSRRPTRPGRPPVMRPPLPARALALANWHAFFANALASKGAAS